MQKNLTHNAVKGLKPPTDKPQLDVWDTRHPGFGISITKAGTKTWQLMYRQHGRKVRLTLGRFPEVSAADAWTRAMSVLGDIAKGEDPAAERAEAKAGPTFAELAHLYLKHHAIPKKKPRSVKEDRYMLDADLLPRWKDRKVVDIRRRDVIALLDDIVARGAKIHANRVRALCSTIFNFAIERDLLEFNPAHKTPQPAEERSRERRLNDDEQRRLWTSLEAEPPQVAALFKLALFTAARRTEVRCMTWRELDLEKGWWTLSSDRSKGGSEHRIPLTASAVALLEQLRANDPDGLYVFPGRVKDQPLHNGQRWIERVRERAGLDDIDFHDLRRTVATGMAELRVEQRIISKILGHAEGSVTSIYDRYGYDREKLEALTKWERHLARVVAGQSNVVPLRA